MYILCPVRICTCTGGRLRGKGGIHIYTCVQYASVHVQDGACEARADTCTCDVTRDVPCDVGW